MLKNKNYMLISSIILASCIALGINSRANAADINKSTLLAEAPNLKSEILDKAIIAYNCAKQKDIVAKHLILVDFSLPSSKKRLWIFNVQNNKLLYHTWVAHGIGSTTLYPTHFSNIPKSKASSLGVYKTGDEYYGAHGHSVKLHGLEQGFNHNALRRSVVFHGAWYVSEDFIKQYGRLGRTWGCLGVEQKLATPIANIITNRSLIVAYYPDKTWLSNSKFLNCK